MRPHTLPVAGCATSAARSLCEFVAGVGARSLAPIAGIAPTALRILLILAVAFVANRLIRRAIHRLVDNVKGQGLATLGALRLGPLARTEPVDLARATLRTETVGTVLRSVSSAVISTIAVVLILDQLGLDVGPLVAGAGIVGVALGFGAQSLVGDFLSGMFILLEDQYGVGDVVDLGEGQTPATGVVESVTLRVTRLRDVMGTVWYVPNGEIRAVGNKSHQCAWSLIDITVPSDTDIGHAKAVITRVAGEVWSEAPWSSVLLEPPDIQGIEDLGTSEVLIRLGVKTGTGPARDFETNRELSARLKKAFGEEGIEIPLPKATAWQRGEISESDCPRRREPGRTRR
jgi:small conductance mechanosensitive channel